MAKKVKAIVIRAAGTNCDRETADVFEACGAHADVVHVNRIKSREVKLDSYHILAIPGGFSYGDDIAAGRIFANELTLKASAQTSKFVADGKLIIGICNGFQVLAKTGLLPGPSPDAPKSKPGKMTVFDNDSGKYECRWVYLKRAENTKCIFTKGMPEIVQMPVAHGEGKVMFDSDSTRESMWKNGQVVFQYVDEKGRFGGFPVNPNGAVDHIAGVCDATGRIFGLMPHPERYSSPLHHPAWTRGGTPKTPSGLLIFRNAVKFAAKHL